MLEKAIVLLAALWMSPCLGANDLVPSEVFKELTSLVGEWEGKNDEGRVVKVSMKLIANGSALIESWTLAPGREAMTVYHLDGPNLLATHYCPRGNQPRLTLSRKKDGEKYVFDFTSATNLTDPKVAYEHQFDIEILDPNSFTRNEVYMQDGDSGKSGIRFFRAAK